MKENIYLAIGIILIVCSFLNINILISPENNLHTTSRIITFNWSGNAEYALVDDNKEFSSPLFTKKAIELEPGVYYWKTEGISLVRKFAIDSEVAVNLRKKDPGYNIKNVGNVPINLREPIIGLAVLDIGEEFETDKENVTFMAEQK